MNMCKPYILKDISDNIWKFTIDKNRHLICDSSYDKVTLDENVLGFDVNISYLGTIELIYITYDGDVKYCEFNKKWTTETLYSLSSKEDKINQINLISTNDETHIFLIFYKEDDETTSDLIHYKWDGKSFNTHTICSINLIPYMEKQYFIEPNSDNKLTLFFITKDTNELVLNTCEYKNTSWSVPKKLYRLNGNNIEFFTIQKDDEFHILNLSEENDIYLLEHVILDSEGIMRNFKVHESTTVLSHPILIIQDNILYSMWLENNDLMYCSFENGWFNKDKITFETASEVINYRYICERNPLDTVKAKSVFASDSENTKILLPTKTLTYNNIIEEHKKLFQNCDAESTIQKLLKEISSTKLLTNKLEKRILILKNQLMTKDSIINKNNEYLNQILIQKKKLEIEYSTLLQRHSKYEYKVKEFENTIQELSKEKENLEVRCRYIKDLEFKLKEKEVQNELIKKELGNEKSKSFIEKLFKIK